MKNTLRSARVVQILLTLSLVFVTSSAHAAGVDPALAAKLETIFPLGSTPDQVLALLGEPELRRQHSKEIAVWRYVSVDTYVLFAFQNDKLSHLARVPIPSDQARDVQTPSRADRWRTLYSGPNTLMGLQLGSGKEGFLRGLKSSGLSVEDVNCARDPKRASVEMCEFAPGSSTWAAMSPTEPASRAYFSLTFEDDRLRSSLHIMPFDREEEAGKAMIEARAALSKAFEMGAESLNGLRRRAASALIPLTSIAEAAKWRSEGVQAVVVRGKVGPRDQAIDAIAVLVFEEGVR